MKARDLFFVFLYLCTSLGFYLCFFYPCIFIWVCFIFLILPPFYQVVRRSRHYLPHIARLCLVSTFLEDGFRLLTQWTEQIDFIRHVWGVGAFLAGIFILVNILLQFSGSASVMFRFKVRAGCAILMLTVVIQTIGYNIWTRVFLMRNLSLVGSLLLLLAEASQESKSLLAGLPSAGNENRSKQYLQLGGRILVVLMFLTLIHWSGSFFYLIQVI